jgi:RimJ/RimL family protein N-acetyltransferase
MNAGAPPMAAMQVEFADWGTLAPAEREAVARLQISVDQVEFAGPVARSVAACEAGDPAKVAGLAIRADGRIVGWVLLKRGASAPDWVPNDAAVVSGLRIDLREQGRGIGALALAELAGWVARRWPRAARLVLRVDEGNVAGIRAYEKAGWREVGERRVGRVGVERTMTLPLR